MPYREIYGKPVFVGNVNLALNQREKVGDHLRGYVISRRGDPLSGNGLYFVGNVSYGGGVVGDCVGLFPFHGNHGCRLSLKCKFHRIFPGGKGFLQICFGGNMGSAALQDREFDGADLYSKFFRNEIFQCLSCTV